MYKAFFWLGKLLGFALLSPIFFCEFASLALSYTLDGFYAAVKKLPGLGDF